MATTSKKVRWECPNGCSGVLGSTRPRRDDVCRYCLDCSGKAGRLVERRAPALERRREAKSAARVRRVASAKDTIDRRETARHSVHGLDLREVVRMAGRLPALKGAAGVPWELWRGKQWVRSGHAYGNSWFVRIIDDDTPDAKTRQEILVAWQREPEELRGKQSDAVARWRPTEDEKRARQSKAVGVILHEMAHIATGKRHGYKARKDGALKFGRCCQRAFAQWNDRHADLVEVNEKEEGAYRGRRSRELRSSGE